MIFKHNHNRKPWEQLHIFRSKVFISKFSQLSSSIFFIFFALPWIYSSSTYIIEVNRSKILENSARIVDCWTLLLSWQLKISSRSSTAELFFLIHSSSSSSLSICFTLPGLEKHDSSSASSLRLEFDCSNSWNNDVHLVDLWFLITLNFRSSDFM